jgi:hypothetical protein
VYDAFMHMGQIPQDRNFGQNLGFFKVELRVTKPDEIIGLIFQLILVHCTLGTLQPSLRKHFLVPCSAPVLALLSQFWVKIRAPVQPNLYSWTGFNLFIIWGVKF